MPTTGYKRKNGPGVRRDILSDVQTRWALEGQATSRGLSERLGLSRRALLHHLGVLEAEGNIVWDRTVGTITRPPFPE